MLHKGDKIGEYTLLEKVGSGGFGDVWKAEKRTVLDVNHFALKFFRPKDEQLDFDKIGKELAVWKQLKGLGNIISVIELDRFDDYVYVVSDFADGGSLEKWIKNRGGKAASEIEAVKITLEILTGLENLHEKGFVHRDLKPDNILIMNGKFCLTDFGVSREVKTHSKATGTAGTIEYMPPEAFEKNPPVTPQTDIWAIGVILQKLLTGGLPFPYEMPALMLAILQSEPEPMPDNVSEGLQEIVKKALQKKREDRFQTAGEMIEALKNPNQFLIAKKQSETETVVKEDLYKTKFLEIEPTQDWRLFDAENKQQTEQVKSQTADEEKETIEKERETILRQIPKEKDLQNREESETNRQPQVDSKEKQESEIETQLISESNTARNIGLGIGIVLTAIVLLAVWLGEKPPASNLYANSFNQINKPVNTRTNKTVVNTPKDLTNTAANNLKISNDYFNIAYNCYEKKDYDCAITNYSKAIELNPVYATAYNNRGIVYHRKGNLSPRINSYYDQAINDYSKAIDLKPDYADAYYGRAGVYFNKGKYDQAIADYRKVLELEPTNKEAKIDLDDAIKEKNRR